MRSHVWHPFTQHGIETDFPQIISTEGAYLYKADGTRVLDAISSWWVVTHAHRHPQITHAIQETASILDQIIFASFTHEQAESLAKALISLAPSGLNWVFYSDSGSTSVEVALKMALGYFHNIGAARSRIVVMEHSYHGDTIGAMSVGARSVFNTAYEPLLFDVDSIPFPAIGHEQQTLDQFEIITRDRNTAALIVEPLVLGAGGMLMYPASVLVELKKIAKASGTLFIVDEVMTGWGRTGTLFACEQADIVPDILCTSKGITGGAVPLAATLATESIFQAHLSCDRKTMFFHSSSYTANPIACAAALANIKIWCDEPVSKRIAELSEMQATGLQRFRDNPHFMNGRTCGTIMALDLRTASVGYLADMSLKMRSFFLDRGLLIRPLGNVLYLLPPYCITQEELTQLYDAIEEVGEIFGLKP